MKPVIVQVVQHLSPGGIETMALDLMKEMNPHAEVHIVSLEGSLAYATIRWPRVAQNKSNLHFLGKSQGLQMGLVLTLRNLLRDLGATAVHTHHIGPLFYGGLAAKLAAVPTHVHTEHDAWHLNNEGNLRLQHMMLHLLRPTLVADCKEVAAELKKHFPFTAPKVILNGIDTSRFVPGDSETRKIARERLELPQDKTLVGCAARLEAVKGHRYLLEALSRTNPSTALVLAGDGSYRTRLQIRAKALGIENRVHFLGALDDMLPFYQAIDLFCLPSLNEGLPLSPLEAQSCDVPVLVSNVGGCPNIVCPHSGELILPGNVTNLASALLRFTHRDRKDNGSPRAFVLNTGNLRKTANAYLSLLLPETTREV